MALQGIVRGKVMPNTKNNKYFANGITSFLMKKI
jgi:hypothetical protein